MITSYMQLIQTLNNIINGDAGYVQTQLAKEDLKRLEKLQELAKSCENEAEMQKQGLYIGWTNGDIRTHELAVPLKQLIKAIYAYENGEKTAELDDKITNIWVNFHQLRLKVLIHCL